MKLPTLYKKTTTGAIQTWQIIMDGDKYRTISGQQDGKKIQNKWTTCKPKNVGRANATTGEEQAIREGVAKHDKKLESGYHLNVEDIDNKRFYEPMLAQDFKNKLRKQTVMNFLNGSATAPAIFSQPKLDGIRCIATKDGLFTRSGKPIASVPHVSEALEGIFEAYPDSVLDGELYSHECKDNFNKIIHLVRKTKLNEEHLQESKDLIKYYIYDAPKIAKLDESANFSDRFAALIYALGSTDTGYSNVWDALVLVQTDEIEGVDKLDEFYSDYIEEGFEGQMIRLDGPYENKRSSKLLKRKEFVDEEYTILGHEEGKGNREGTLKHLKFESKNGKPFNSNIKGTFEYLTELFENADSLIGKEATVKYFNLTPDGVPRFPYVIAIRDYE